MSAESNAPCCGPGYASPQAAMQAPREKLLYTVALYIGTGIQKPDYLATIDADPESPTYSQVISRLEMPGIGDELHHMGWNACSSCHHDATKERRYLILPGVRSSNLHIVDCAADPRNPSAAPRHSGRRDQGEDQPLSPAYGALPRLGHHHFHAGRCARRSAGRFFTSQREVRDRRPLGKRPGRHEVQLRLLVPAAPQRHGVQRVGRAQHVYAGLRPGGGRASQIRPRDPLLEFCSREKSRGPSIWAKMAWCRSKCASITTRIPATALSARRSRPTLSTGTKKTRSGLSRRSLTSKTSATRNGPFRCPA